MYDRFDKILPGPIAKTNFILDIVLLLLALSMAAPTVYALNVTAFCLTGLATIGTWSLSVTFLRLYSPCTPRSNLDSAALGTSASIATTAAMFLAELGLDSGVSMIDFLKFGLSFACLENFIRIVIIGRLEERYPGAPDMALVVGVGPIGTLLAKHLALHHRRRKVIGFLRFSGEPTVAPGGQLPVFGDASALLSVLKQHPVDEVYIAGRIATQAEQMQAAVRACEEVGMPFAMPMDTLDFKRATAFPSPPPDHYVHYLTAEPKPAQIAIKRLIDISASTCALVLLSPLLIGVAVAIHLTSPGPILFRQERVGLHGYVFNMFKFRSMLVNAEALRAQLEAENEQSGPVFKMKNDPRMTAVGRFIRKYSIDELPQLINILRGDMTIVGPRPAIPAEVEQYASWQRRRLSVRPGLTCFWQVGGRNQVSFDEWMQLDLKYIDHWSLGVDLRLMLKTVPVVLGGNGAS